MPSIQSTNIFQIVAIRMKTTQDGDDDGAAVCELSISIVLSNTNLNSNNRKNVFVNVNFISLQGFNKLSIPSITYKTLMQNNT